jgi:hypothetical protein
MHEQSIEMKEYLMLAVFAFNRAAFRNLSSLHRPPYSNGE